jgi:hypothetical protein
VLKYLRDGRDRLAMELGTSLDRDDDADKAFGVLLRLAGKHAGDTAGHPALTTAMCLVYDEPHTAAATRGKNKKPDAIDPVAVFDYFLANESRLEFQPESLPPQVLIYLVDTEATPAELAWAMKDHAGDRNVGKRYFDLVYDTASFKFNAPKKIASMPYTLENIRKVGGVCEEQAYYAAHVGKAIGVPATIITGRSSTVSHAWVGFLQQRGGMMVWNVNEGHYDEYEKLRGNVRDPQTGRTISDDELALTADLCSLAVGKRQEAVALAEAARSVLNGSDWPPQKPDGMTGGLDTARAAGAPGALDLLAQAQALAPCFPRVWWGVKEAAPKMDAKARQWWLDRLNATCGRKYPPLPTRCWLR